MKNYKSIALIIDDFSDRIAEYENVYLYDYMVNTSTTYFDDYYYDYYADLVNPFGFGSVDRTTSIDLFSDYYHISDYYQDTFVSSETSSPVFDVYDSTYDFYAYEGYTYSENYLSRLPADSFITDEPGHGDWVIEAFTSALDNPEDVEIIAVDLDYGEDYSAVFSEGVLENIFNHAYNLMDDLEYNFLFGGLNASFGRSDVNIEWSAITDILSADAFVVQAAPNTGQAGVNWGDFFPNVVNVGAYNVDKTGDLLFHDADDYENIDILADGYVRNEDWSEQPWNFGTSFAAPRVFAEIFNFFGEVVYPYLEQNSEEISYENLSSAEETVVTNAVIDAISTDVVLLLDGPTTIEHTLPVLTDQLTQSLYPTEVPLDYPTSLPWTVSSALLTDTTAPSAPVITSIAEDGVLTEDELSDWSIRGTAEPGSTVTIAVEDDPMGAVSTTADSSGGWAFKGADLEITSLSDLPPEGDGDYSFTVKATDAAGNASQATTGTITVDVGQDDGLQSTPYDASTAIYAYRIEGIAVDGEDNTDGDWIIKSDPSESVAVVYGSSDLEFSFIEDAYDDGHIVSVSKGELYDLQINGLSIGDPRLEIDWSALETVQLGSTATPVQIFSLDATVSLYEGWSWGSKQVSNILYVDDAPLFDELPSSSELQDVVDKVDSGQPGYSVERDGSTIVSMSEQFVGERISDIPNSADGITTKYDAALDGDIKEFTFKGFSITQTWSEEDGSEDFLSAPTEASLVIRGSADLELYSEAFYGDDYENDSDDYDQELRIVSGEIYQVELNGQPLEQEDDGELYTFIQDITSPTFGKTVVFGLELAKDNIAQTNVFYLSGDKFTSSGVPSQTELEQLINEVESGSGSFVPIPDAPFQFSNYEHVTVSDGEGSEVSNNNPATGSITISGLTQEDGVLTADLSSVDDRDSFDADAVEFTWYADNIVIDDASGKTLTLTQDLVGKTIRVEGSFLDSLGNTEFVTSSETRSIRNINDKATGEIVLSGSFQVSDATDEITANIDSVVDEDGIDSSTITYQWLRDGVTVAGADSATYDLTADDVLSRLAVVYSHVDNFGGVERIVSDYSDLIISANSIQRAIGSSATKLVLDGGTGSEAQTAADKIAITDKSSLLQDITDLEEQIAALSEELNAILGLVSSDTDLEDSSTGFAETVANTLASEPTKNFVMQSLDLSDLDDGEADRLAFTSDVDDDEITSLVVDLGTSARELVVDGVEFLSVKGTATVRGGEGSNNFLGDGASQNVMLGADDDVLNAGGGDDIVGSAGGNDTISGGSGNDVTFGGTGNDSVRGGTGDDKVTDSWGTDALNGDDGNDVIRAFEGGDIIDGGAGADTIYGSRGDDVISGGDDNDVIYGDTFVFASRGADELSGGNGNDVLQGGFGADTFVFNSGETGDNRIERIATQTADFEVGIDTIKLVDFGETLTADNILGLWENTSEGAKLTAGDMSIQLTGISASDLSVNDFEFV